MMINIGKIIRMAMGDQGDTGNRVRSLFDHLMRGIREFTGIQEFTTQKSGKDTLVTAEVPDIDPDDINTEEEALAYDKKHTFGLDGVQVKVGPIAEISPKGGDPGETDKMAALITFYYKLRGVSHSDKHHAGPQGIKADWESFLDGSPFQSVLKSGLARESEDSLPEPDPGRPMGQGDPGSRQLPMGAGASMNHSIILLLDISSTDRESRERLNRVVEESSRKVEEAPVKAQGPPSPTTYKEVIKDLHRQYGELPPEERTHLSFNEFRRQELEKRRGEQESGTRGKLWSSERFCGVRPRNILKKFFGK